VRAGRLLDAEPEGVQGKRSGRSVWRTCNEVVTPHESEGVVPVRKEALLVNVTPHKQEFEKPFAILPFRFDNRVSLL
jgi:hypothetical protein